MNYETVVVPKSSSRRGPGLFGQVVSQNEAVGLPTALNQVVEAAAERGVTFGNGRSAPSL